ncbi:MAG: PD40 domain-containing protein [Actinobacteria bacterium]|nr:PD40 domain-containing protein [Actinomycetota bacterium]
MYAGDKRKDSYHGRRRMAALKLMMSLLTACLLLTLVPGTVHAAPGDVTLVSSDAGGLQGNGASNWVSMSSDDRYVVFQSSATNLVDPATTGEQIFRKELLTGEVELVSSGIGGVEGNNVSNRPVISPDGRYVAFESLATNLVSPATTNRQVFLRDIRREETFLVSMDATGAEGDGDSYMPSISDDGRYVAFESLATNLVSPATAGWQVFRRDMSGEVELASADAGGTPGNGNADFSADISPDGRYVCFTSDSTNLVTPGTSGKELFSKDMLNGEVVLASSDASGAESNNGNGYPSYSSDARYVSFCSNASNLIPGITGSQIYRKDLVTREIVLVSADASGNQGNSGSGYSSISADGRYVAFGSQATNLASPATTGWEIFRKDIVTGEIVIVSAASGGTEGNGDSRYPSISADGRYVAFDSKATDLVIPATTGEQVFLKELATPYHFYFAEGYTGAGFQEYLCLGNPGDAGAFATITYMFPDGTTQEQEVELGANSRVTVDVNAAVGPDREVSAMVACDLPFVAERPMYFAYQGTLKGGHDVVGAPAPACNWYFAEGYTGAGFDEWICVLNPGDLPAELTFRFQTQEEGEKRVTGFVVGPHTRASFKANDLLGGGSYQTSLKLEANHPVVAERPTYFSYTGRGSWGWTGGHCVMGATSLATNYFFAEGTTRAGFEEWLCIQNPQDHKIDVYYEYVLSDGNHLDFYAYGIEPGKRITIYVPNDIGTEKDASVGVSAYGDYFLVERPMYFEYSGLGDWGWTGGHCVIGSTERASEWFFAEGYTGAGFEEWLCIWAANDVTITYYPEGGGDPIVRNHEVASWTRLTVPVNVDAGSEQAVSARISSSSTIYVERPMYFNFHGTCPGGHDTMGFTP